MGISNSCCRKNDIDYEGSELPLFLETDVNNDDNINNKTFRRSYLWNKKNNELFVKTEQNADELKVKDDKDYFMTNFIKYLDSQNDNLKFQAEDSDTFNTLKLQKFMRTSSSYPILCLNIYNFYGINDDNDLHKFKQVLKLNPLGIIGDTQRGKIKKYDGESFFGIDLVNKGKNVKNLANSSSTSYINSNNITCSNDSSSKNDFTLDINPDDNEYILLSSSDFSKRLFSIKFDLNTFKFNIRDLHSGIPTFKSIKSETVIENNTLIYIGESYIHITFGEETKEESSTEFINLKIYDKYCKMICDPINFQPSKSCIRIGRFKENEIIINDILVSRTHCSIQYDKVVGWTIRDGKYSKISNSNNNFKTHFYPSTNGTWLYIRDRTPIVDGTIFKSSSLTFECVLEES